MSLLHRFEEALFGHRETILTAIYLVEKNMSAQLDALTAEVADVKAVNQAAITLISGIADRVSAAAYQDDDGAALSALTADLKSSAASLAAAVTANTPATPAAAPVTSAPAAPVAPGATPGGVDAGTNADSVTQSVALGGTVDPSVQVGTSADGVAPGAAGISGSAGTAS